MYLINQTKVLFKPHVLFFIILFKINFFFLRCFQLFSLPWTLTSPRLSYQIMEEQSIGTKLTTLQATDADSNIEEYHLADNDYFTINNLTGS